MLNLERLRTLDALARHGSVSGAAEGLHVTTSAVSQQMAKLEREVGQQLLAKNGRGVRLTDAGRLLADHAARILSQVELAQSDLEAQRGQVVGELRLAAFPTAVRGLFPAALPRPARRASRRCACAHGSWNPRLGDQRGGPRRPRPGRRPRLVQQAAARARRAGQGRDPRRPGGGGACPTDHPLAGRDEVDLRELRRGRVGRLARGRVLPRMAAVHAARQGHRAPHRATGPGSTTPNSPWSPPGWASASRPGSAATRCRPGCGPCRCGRRCPRARLRGVARRRRPAAVDQGGGRGAAGGGRARGELSHGCSHAQGSAEPTVVARL